MNSVKTLVCLVLVLFVAGLGPISIHGQEHNNSGIVFKMPGCSTEGPGLESTVRYIDEALRQYGSVPGGEIRLFYRLELQQNVLLLRITSQSGDHRKVNWAPLKVPAHDLDCKSIVLRDAGGFFVHANCEKKKQCVLNVTDTGSEPFSDRLSIGMTTDQEHAVHFAQAFSRLIYLLSRN